MNQHPAGVAQTIMINFELSLSLLNLNMHQYERLAFGGGL
jgi:hypothetical protein